MEIAYFVIGVLLIIGEVLLPIFVLLPLGVGSIAAGIAYWMIASHGFALLAFAIASLVTVWIVKRSIRLKSQHHPVIGLVGQIGTIEINHHGTARVRVFGDLWEIYRDPQTMTALPAEGTQVKIANVIGNKVTIQTLE